MLQGLEQRKGLTFFSWSRRTVTLASGVNAANPATNFVTPATTKATPGSGNSKNGGGSLEQKFTDSIEAPRDYSLLTC